MTEARVVIRHDQPVLEVNGKPVAPLMVFVNPTAGDWQRGLSTVRRAAAAGVNIVSFVNHELPMPRAGEEADYTSWDRIIDAILEANPNALLLPRFGMDNVPAWWGRENPDELMLYDNGDRGLPSMASEKWKRDAGEAMRLLVRHCERKYGEHMLGYHPCGQNTGEWFYDRSWENLMPGLEAPMQAAFQRWVHDPAAVVPTAEERRLAGLGAFLDPVPQRRLVDFLGLQQAAMEQPLEYFARIIKQETHRRKLVVYFYGYTFEISALPGGPSASGHLALQALLDCPDVDIICSPVSYFDRQPGGAGPFMAPVDSVQVHGKLWLNEDDTRTYLSIPEDSFGRAGTLEETVGVHNRNFAQIASRGAACWWMDLPGAGWLDSVEIWEDLHRLEALYDDLAPTREPYRPEVAVVVDEASLLHLSYGSQVSSPLLCQVRHELYRMGTPLGFYLMSDVCAGKVTWPKLYIILDALALDRARREALLRAVSAPGKTTIWFYGPGFIEDGQASADLVAQITGIRVAREAAPDTAWPHSGASLATPISAAAVVSEQARDALPGVRAGEEFGPEERLAPLFFVDDADARPLATYKATGKIAAAVNQSGGWSSVFVGTLRATPSLLREIARLAGAHVYLRSDDVVLAGGGLVAVHATSDGEKVLHLPRGTTAKDAWTRASIGGPATTLRFVMKRGETRTFIIQRGS